MLHYYKTETIKWGYDSAFIHTHTHTHTHIYIYESLIKIPNWFHINKSPR